jgi:hypothetical protein
MCPARHPRFHPSRFPPGHPSRGGRPVGPNPRVRHLARALPKGGGPYDVTLKVKPGISLRGAAIARELEETFRNGAEQGRFRLARYAIEDDHVHLHVEAKDVEELSNAMKALGARFSRSVNRALGRTGNLIADRYRILDPAKDGPKKLRCGCPEKKKTKPAARRAR